MDDKYKVYLLSDKWKTIKNKILAKYNNRCVFCGSDNKLQVHHLSYKHIYDEGNHLEDLVLVCDKCHKMIHNIPSNNSYISLRIIQEMLIYKDINKRYELFNEHICTDDSIKSKKPDPPYIMFPNHLRLLEEDDYKTQNTKLILIYFCGVKKLHLTLYKLNQYFGTNYKKVKEAIDGLLDINNDYGNFDFEDIMCGRRFAGYEIKILIDKQFNIDYNIVIKL